MPRALLIRERDGWSLPQWIHEARRGRTARELDDPFWPAAIREELRRQLSVQTIVLHADLHDLRDARTGDRHTVFVLENHSPHWTPRAGAQWVSRAELPGLALVDAGHRRALEAWFAEAEGGVVPGHRPAWQRPGWFASAIAWVADELGRRGAAVVGPAEQLGTKVGRFLMRVRTTGAPGRTGGAGAAGGMGARAIRETAYFKAVPAMYARECGVLRLLNELADGAHRAHVPELLACDGERHWLLTWGREGRKLSDVDDLEAWEAALRAFADIQVASAPRTDDLLAAGCTNLAVETLEAQFVALLADGDALLADEPGGLSASDLAALRAVVPWVRGVGERLASHAPPPTLVHGDLLPGNVLVEGDGTAVFFDWCEATVSHPFFSPVRFLASAAWNGAPVRAQVDLYARLRNAYLQRWSAFGTYEHLVTAFELARALQPVQHALTYWHLYRVLAAEGDAQRTWERRGVAAASLKRLLDQGVAGRSI